MYYITLKAIEKYIQIVYNKNILYEMIKLVRTNKKTRKRKDIRKENKSEEQ